MTTRRARRCTRTCPPPSRRARIEAHGAGSAQGLPCTALVCRGRRHDRARPGATPTSVRRALNVPATLQLTLHTSAGPADHPRLRRPGALPAPVHGRAGRQWRLVVCVPVHRALGRLPPGHDCLGHPHRRLHPDHGHLLKGACRCRLCSASAPVTEPQFLTACLVRFCELRAGQTLILAQTAEQ